MKLLFWVHLHSVLAGEREMEVRACGVSGVSAQGDDLSGMHVVSLLRLPFGEVRIAGLVSVPVGDNHLFAAGVVGHDAGDLPRPRGAHFRPNGNGNIHAVVVGGSTGNRSGPGAEFAGDSAFHRLHLTPS